MYTKIALRHVFNEDGTERSLDDFAGLVAQKAFGYWLWHFDVNKFILFADVSMGISFLVDGGVCESVDDSDIIVGGRRFVVSGVIIKQKVFHGVVIHDLPSCNLPKPRYVLR